VEDVLINALLVLEKEIENVLNVKAETFTWQKKQGV